MVLVVVGCWAAMIWATIQTYEAVPPIADRFVTRTGATVMNGEDIIAGKAGFQKADLMDYGGLFGMGSYFGEVKNAFDRG
jgi:nitric oxide reductase subunit B